MIQVCDAAACRNKPRHGSSKTAAACLPGPRRRLSESVAGCVAEFVEICREMPSKRKGSSKRRETSEDAHQEGSQCDESDSKVMTETERIDLNFSQTW